MSVQPETLFKNKVMKRLKKYGAGIWVIKIQQMTSLGDPDLIICAWGHFVAWELKTITGKVSKLQEHKLSKISKALGIARVVSPYNVDTAFNELEKLEFMKHG